MLEAFLAVPFFLISVLLTAIVLRLAVRAQLIALPSARGSHHIPTPVGGGFAIVSVYFLGLSTLWQWQFIPLNEFFALSASLMVAIVGLLDDRRHVDFRVRLLVQCLAVFWGLVWLAPLPQLKILTSLPEVSLVVWLFFSLVLLWMTNLYNFMDGIDGFAGSQACFAGLAAAGFLVYSEDYGLALLCLYLFAGATGFLVWNWPPARIFMGDVGSGFIGFSLGLIAVLSLSHGSMSVWSWALLMGCFIVDATLTLARRVLSGERWYEAHCSHTFQIAARKFADHGRVTIGLLLIDVLWLLPLAMLAAKHPEYGVYLTTAGLIPLVLIALWFNAGNAPR
ncbi:MAG: glycosyltransferase family 4 protein [Pseudomonadota bacterium]